MRGKTTGTTLRLVLVATIPTAASPALAQEIEVYDLPDGSRSHDVAPAPDGKVWFTGQSGFYGRLDPASGEMEVFGAPEGRGPYGIAATPAGEIYFVSLAGSYLAWVDRASGAVEVIEPPTPDQGARRGWSDSTGKLRVSECNAGQVARYDPSDGSWREWKLPGDVPRAYAVYVDERDIVWLSDFGGDAIHAFDPASETFTTYPKSERGGDVRPILGRPGEVWLPESGVDRLMVIRTAVTQ